MKAFGRRPILVNRYEQLVDQKLLRLSKRHGVRVFPKVGLKDVLPIEKSGLTDNNYDYALKAHFDFVIAGENDEAVIAVEFDESHHRTDPVQIARDRRKDRICDHFLLPILRAGAPSLKQADHRTLLEWFLEVWFEQRALYAARDAEEEDLPDIDPAYLDYATYGQPRFDDEDDDEDEDDGMRGFVRYAPLDAFGKARERVARFDWEHDLGTNRFNGWFGQHPAGHHVGYLGLEVEPGTWLLSSGRADLRGVELWLGWSMHAERVAQDIALLDLARKLDAWEEGRPVAVSTEVLRRETSSLEEGAFAPLPLPNRWEMTEIVLKRLEAMGVDTSQPEVFLHVNACFSDDEDERRRALGLDDF
jgi:hypothetical protein